MYNESLDDDIDWVALTRYYRGELSQDERDALERWIDHSADRRALVERLAEVWRRAGDLREQWDADAALPLIKARGQQRPDILSFPAVIPVPAVIPLRRAPTRRAVPGTAASIAAAAAALLIVGGALAYRKLTDRPVESPAVVTSEVVTRRAQRATVRLSDGTRITLAPASQLRYAQTYGVGRREVFLEGQALFEVVHDSATPFVVRTAQLVATDLGTTFGVRAYPDDGETEVVVTQGVVALRRSLTPFGLLLAPTRAGDAGVEHTTTSPPTLGRSQGRSRDSLVLRAGDVGVMSADSLQRRPVADASARTAWTEGRLVFTDTRLADALTMLGRWYDVDLRLANGNLAGRRLTATFHDESLAEVVRLIADALELRVTHRDRSLIVFAARGRSTSVVPSPSRREPPTR